MKTRFLSVFLAFVLCCGLVIPAFATAPEFEIENGVLTKYNGPGGDVVIPSGVTEIGQKAFRNCTSLTSITIPDSVTEIGAGAFAGCTGLTSVTIPDSVTVLRGDIITFQGAFAWCTGLTHVTIPNSVSEIGACAFQGCSGLTSVTIPNSVTKIGDRAFRPCTSLTSVTIPNSVTEIGVSAFWGCIIYGYKNSAAERYAKENDLPFVLLGTPATPSFTDVPNWCENAVNWAVAEEITSGTGGNEFSPLRTCTHGEILAFLWRAKGEPDAKAKAPFTVASYFQDAVDWAYGEGLIGASTDTTADCTRSDAVKYIWQASNKPTAPGSGFTDVPAGASYAPAVNWAVANGVTAGTNDGSTFSPGKTCTRGEIVTFLHRAFVPEVRLG